MNNRITFKQIIDRLNENEIKYQILKLSDDFKIVIMEKGGRIFGPYQNDNSESIWWTNKAFATKESFLEFLNNNEWNYGGDRVWMAPEFPFFNKDRNEFFDSYTVQPQLDPANYELTVDSNNNVNLFTDVNVPLFQMEYKDKQFSIERTIRRNNNPLRNIKEFIEGELNVKFCGFEQEVMVIDNSKDKKMPLEFWDLTQINPGGSVIVPFFGEFEFVDYYNPIPNSIQIPNENFVELKIQNGVSYKAAYKAAKTMGRAGYINRLDEENHYLFIRNYFNDPSSIYCCEPYNKEGQNGCSLYVYIDSGDLGGFAEFENSGRTFGEGTSRNKSTDVVNYWFFVGKKDKLEKIVQILLGVNIKDNWDK